MHLGLSYDSKVFFYFRMCLSYALIPICSWIFIIALNLLDRVKAQYIDDNNVIRLKHSGTVHKKYVYFFLFRKKASVKTRKKESVHTISVLRIHVQTKYKCTMLQNKDFKAMFNIWISSQDSLGKNEKWEKNTACTDWTFMCCSIPWQNGPNQLLKHPLVQCP